jgi:hypothetical protein
MLGDYMYIKRLMSSSYFGVGCFRSLLTGGALKLRLNQLGAAFKIRNALRIHFKWL